MPGEAQLEGLVWGLEYALGYCGTPAVAALACTSTSLAAATRHTLRRRLERFPARLAIEGDGVHRWTGAGPPTTVPAYDPVAGTLRLQWTLAAGALDLSETWLWCRSEITVDTPHGRFICRDAFIDHLDQLESHAWCDADTMRTWAAVDGGTGLRMVVHFRSRGGRWMYAADIAGVELSYTVGRTRPWAATWTTRGAQALGAVLGGLGVLGAALVVRGAMKLEDLAAAPGRRVGVGPALFWALLVGMCQARLCRRTRLWRERAPRSG